MNKIALSLSFLILISCGGSIASVVEKKPLFEVLTIQKDGGGNIHFFEVISDSREFRMLQNDKKLRRKIKPNDIDTSNFLILNMGKKKSNNATIEVVAAEETATEIILTIKENDPIVEGANTLEYTYPYTIVKINSKKEISVK
jgi:hypothetical protein